MNVKGHPECELKGLGLFCFPQPPPLLVVEAKSLGVIMGWHLRGAKSFCN